MELSDKETKVLEDMAAFIAWSIEHGQPLRWVLANIAHDCSGILNDIPGFLPRTSGYSSVMKGEK